MKDSLYYVYRIQYENLINDLDNFSAKMNSTKISKDKLLNELNKIIRSNYSKVYLLKDLIKEEDI